MLLTIGDPHIQESNLQDTRNLSEFLVTKLVNKGISYVVIMGDMFHTHAVIRQNVIHAANEFVKDMSKIGEVYYITGNHDNADPRGGELNAANLTLKGAIISNHEGHVNIPGTNYYLIGFRKNEDFVSEVQKIASLNPNAIIMGHQTLQGAVYESGMEAHGAIEMNLLPQVKQIHGHVHKRQTVSSGMVVYPGTPRSLSFSDKNEIKGVSIFDINGNEKEFISTNEATKCYYEIDLDESQTTGIFKPNKLWKAGDNVKINISGTKDSIDKFKEVNKFLFAGNFGRIQVVPHIKKINNKNSLAQKRTNSMEDLFYVYVKEVYNMDNDMRELVLKEMQGKVIT